MDLVGIVDRTWSCCPELPWFWTTSIFSLGLLTVPGPAGTVGRSCLVLAFAPILVVVVPDSVHNLDLTW